MSFKQPTSASTLFGICGIGLAAASMAIWTILICRVVFFSSQYPREMWETDPENLNSLQMFIHAIATILAGGFYGMLGLIVGGCLSCCSILASSIGLIWTPRSYPVIGLALGIGSLLPGLAFIVLVMLAMFGMIAA